MKKMSLSERYVGKPLNRVDGRLKVTGKATYAAENDFPGLVHGVVVTSPIARGRVVKIDSHAALALPGVLLVITHENRGKLRKVESSLKTGLLEASRLPLADDKIHYAGQALALVVAETLEQAQEAAARLPIETLAEDGPIRLEEAEDGFQPEKDANGQPLQITRGDVDLGLARSPVRIDATYETPSEHPTPMEPHATTARWEGGELTVHDATQWPMGNQHVLSKLFGIPAKKVHIVSPFVGGMFGCKAVTASHIVLSVLAAKELGRPVKTALTRDQVLTSVGYRSRTVQRFELGADRDGRLSAMRHTTTSQTSELDDFAETTNLASRVVYGPPNYQSIHYLKRVHTVLPAWMRGPGETPGQYAQECAMDELAEELGMDPVELRRRNDTQIHPVLGLPFSGRHLIECLDRGAEAFGWTPRGPRTRRDGRLLVGHGMAVSTYPGFMMGATVRAELSRQADGVKLVVETACNDSGTGLYTAAAMLAAEALALPIERVESRLGDSRYARGALAGGSNLTASVTPATYQACARIRALLTEALLEGPFAGRKAKDLTFEQGAAYVTAAPEHKVSYAEILEMMGKDKLEAQGETNPVEGENGEVAFQSFGAIFCEVAVDPDTFMTRTRRVSAVYDAGRIVSAKTARSQMLGGIVFGLGMALMEELVPDASTGRFINANFGDYHVPVNADMPRIDVSFVDEPDFAFNPIGCRGIGELGNPGTAAAVANAIYNATGARIRSLPITPEKIMKAMLELPAEREDELRIEQTT